MQDKKSGKLQDFVLEDNYITFYISLGICHDIKGTDGTQFPPGLDKDKRLWMFVSDLCRSIWVDFEEEVKVQGITAYRYRPPKDVFDMGNPDNFCYCPDFLECACPTGNFTGNVL